MNRSNSAIRTWAACVLLMLLSVGPFAELGRGHEPPRAEASSGKTVRLLTVGNSFSRNATRFLGELAEAGGHELIQQSATVGGASLELHANKAAAHERDPADKAGLYANGKSLKQMLQSERWDVVTIQQASIKTHDRGTYQPYADRLARLIRQHAPQAKLRMHQTWAYRVDDPRFKRPATKPGEPATQAAMYEGLVEAYRQTAQEIDAGLIPVGEAFYRVDTDPQWGFRPDPEFDPKRAIAPMLPDQTHSLHVGWRWRKQEGGTPRLGYDGHHANAAGEYLGACVWYETLFGKSVVGNRFVPDGIDAAFAKNLQQTAHEVVEAAVTEGAVTEGAVN